MEHPQITIAAIGPCESSAYLDGRGSGARAAPATATDKKISIGKTEREYTKKRLTMTE
jgi:hypothetical protein